LTFKYKSIIIDDTIFQVDATTGSEVSRDELVIKSENVAKNLIAMGVNRGDVIVIFAVKSIEFGVVLVAALRIGAIPAPLDCFGTIGMQHVSTIYF